MRVCLVTTGQPSTNPRLVKEADALCEAGYHVHVVAAHWADWATPLDEQLLAERPWRMTLIDWRREGAPGLFIRSRVRHKVARWIAPLPGLSTIASLAALSRVGPELAAAAASVPAELYIAHNLGALPAAHQAAARRSARVGFDAEDFHSGQLSRPEEKTAAALARDVERWFLPRCTYVTAAAPGIAEAYHDLCDIPLPTCILNVFPLSDRPTVLRQGDFSQPLRLYWFSQTIGPDRGLEDAVRAMGLLRPDRVELHLRGRWHAGYEERLRRLAAASGVTSDRIVSHAPAQPSEMVRLASTYDIGLALEPPVSTNNDILLSNKIFTYLLAGTAVIATRTRGQHRMATELGPSTMWSDAGSPETAAATLQSWLDDRESLELARRHAWHLGETRFNWNREKIRFLDVVDKAVGPSRFHSSWSTELQFPRGPGQVTS